MNLVEFSEFLVSHLAKEEDLVKVKEFDTEEGKILEILVSESDMGRVIGKKGKIANSVKTLIQAKAYNEGVRNIKVIPIVNPIIPKKDTIIINKYLQNLITPCRFKYVNSSEQIDVKATTITIIGETSPALTAASPNTRAPKIERDVPLDVGVLESPS